MALFLVTVGTDGNKNWVETPEGQKFSLGAVSVLTFVTKLVPSVNMSRRILDSFLKEGEAMLRVDEDKMWALLEPKRARWASSSNGSFIPRATQRTLMDNLPEILAKTESVIAYCDKQASAGKSVDSQAFKDLQITAQKLANQSDNSYFYGLGEPKLDRPESGFANEETSEAGLVPKAAGLTFDIYEANLKVAENILGQTQATVAKINKLASEGKKFKREAALKDVAAVTNRVASICEKTALTEDWVAEDLQKLASESKRLHGLFHA